MAGSATGTPTTNYAFPTLQTDVDAPNGTGINNIITDIDDKLLTELDAIDTTIAALPLGASLALVIAMG